LDSVVAAFAGPWVSFAVTPGGTLWTWGKAACGGDLFNTNTPVQFGGLTGVIGATAGQTHGLALKADGTVWACGQNYLGEVGDGTRIPHPDPVQVSGVTEVVSIAAGSSHSLALKADGTIWAWGDNLHGQLGSASTQDCSGFPCILSPTQVGAISDVAAIGAGFQHSLALRADGTVWAWCRRP
jgi:alpha-tubulin suppressor-like RCC1 family protein